MGLQRLADLKADGEAGIERRHRLLEDHRHVLAGEAAPLARRDIVMRSAPSKAMRSAVTVAVGGRSPITASIATDLPEPDSPTIASTSLRSSVRSKPSTALNGAVPGGEGDGEVADFEEGQRHQPLPHLRIERVAQAVAGEVDRDDGDEDGEARKGDDPGIGADEFARVREHRAPFRRRRLGAEAEEAEPRRFEDGVETPSAAITISGARQLGSTVDHASRSGPTPATRAAVT